MRDQQLMHSRSWGRGLLQFVGDASTIGAISDQFIDAEEKSPIAAVTTPLSPLPKEQTPKEGDTTSDLSVNPHPGNKFTQTHSPRTTDESSQDSIYDLLQSDSQEPRPQTPEICAGTPNPTTQLLLEHSGEQITSVGAVRVEQPDETEEVETSTSLVLNVSTTLAAGCPTISQEKDELLGSDEVTLQVKAVCLLPEEMSDAPPDITLTSKVVGDDMAEI